MNFAECMWSLVITRNHRDDTYSQMTGISARHCFFLADQRVSPSKLSRHVTKVQTQMWNRWKSACREAVASINRCMIIIIVHLITLERNQIFDKRQKSRFVKETVQRDCNRLYKLINKEMISRSDKSKYLTQKKQSISSIAMISHFSFNYQKLCKH